MEYTEIQKLIDSMGESKLTDLDIEFADGTKISMKKNNASVTSVAPSVEATATVVSSVSIEEKREVTNQNVKIVKAPMVGTFYSKANPTSNPFVLEGDKIEKGQTLCIVEAMKLMNEIESDYAGTIKKVLVSDGEMVEYGQPLFEIE
jgi:acetyl-CoA carboxylase biotin carboxyl carrier protein